MTPRRGVALHLACAALAALLWLSTSAAHAGSLAVFEEGGSPGSFLLLPGPATAVLIDVNFDATSSEGGGLFGMSEVTFFATGDLSFDMTGFNCELSSCISAPEFFAGGNLFQVTGGDDLNGEFASEADLVNVRVSGNTGYVGLARGEYLDATNAGPSIGTLRKINVHLFARVPEPTIGLGLMVGSLGLTAAARKRRDWASRNGKPAANALRR